MFRRSLEPPRGSFFLFGPRGTGKSTWVRDELPGAVHLDLLESGLYLELLAAPERLESKIPPEHRGWVVLDEVQRVPALLDEVHRLIEKKRLRFALTGSSARKLRRGGVNLLAGRAVTLRMHPLTRAELGTAFDLQHSLRFGQLPVVQADRAPGAARAYLSSYVATYLREEVMQEGLTRNLAAFSRFLEAASFSQASPLNISAVARDCAVERKVVEDYFGILEDLLIGVRLPVFTRRARRRVVGHPKFFFFDVGVFRAVRPRGPLDIAEEVEGAALETLLLEELRALNDYAGAEYSLHYWRSATGLEVDFVLYGERGLCAFEVKRSARVRREDLKALEAFLEDYPMARAVVAYGGSRVDRAGAIRILPFARCLQELPAILGIE